MRLASLPLFDRLADSRSVLLAGAGGGFDVYAALPLFFGLRDRGVSVHIASLSFASLRDVDARRPAASVLEITADTRGPEYFPEAMLARWLETEGGVRDARVFAFEMGGVRPLRNAYEVLCADLAIDAIVLVDGGTDSLVRGDEVGLGTPEADMASLVAVDGVSVSTRLLVSIGFGVDSFRGVSHALVLENIARIDRAGGYLGAFSWLATMPEVQRYRDAVAAARSAMPESASIVHGAIVTRDPDVVGLLVLAGRFCYPGRTPCCSCASSAACAPSCAPCRPLSAHSPSRRSPRGTPFARRRRRSSCCSVSP